MIFIYHMICCVITIKSIIPFNIEFFIYFFVMSDEYESVLLVIRECYGKFYPNMFFIQIRNSNMKYIGFFQYINFHREHLVENTSNCMLYNILIINKLLIKKICNSEHQNGVIWRLFYGKG